MTKSLSLLERAPLRDVLRGRAPLVGSRLDPAQPRGFVSPIEPRLNLGIFYTDLAAEEARYLRESHRLAQDLGIVLRSLATSALAPSQQAPDGHRPHIVSADVDPITVDAALHQIVEVKDPSRARVVFFVHSHALNLATFDATLRDDIRRADLVLPDGSGIRLAARILGETIPHNLNGTDLLPLLCERAAATGTPLALVGAAPGIAESCARNLKAATPGLAIPFVSHGFLDEEGIAQVRESIRDLGRVVVLVAMGSPRQERFAWQHLSDLPNATVLTVGGLFDFFSDRIPRAPQLMRELGVEWAFRLAQEPRRLAKRYVLGNPLFIALAVGQRLGLR